MKKRVTALQQFLLDRTLDPNHLSIEPKMLKDVKIFTVEPYLVPKLKVR